MPKRCVHASGCGKSARGRLTTGWVALCQAVGLDPKTCTKWEVAGRTHAVPGPGLQHILFIILYIIHGIRVP
eukprot:241289-Prorocentrum_minimum.AAC.1